MFDFYAKLQELNSIEDFQGMILPNTDFLILTHNNETIEVSCALWNMIYRSCLFLNITKDKRVRKQNGVVFFASPDHNTSYDPAHSLLQASGHEDLYALLVCVFLSNSILATGFNRLYDKIKNDDSIVITKRMLQEEPIFLFLKEVVEFDFKILSHVQKLDVNMYSELEQKELMKYSLASLLGELNESQLTRTRVNDNYLKDKKIENDEIIIELTRSYYNGLIASMMDGTSAVGKTLRYRKIAQNLGLPLYVQNFSVNVDESTIIGKLVPNGKGGIMVIEGEFTQAFRYGGFYVAEELNRCRSDVTVSLNTALSEGWLVLPDGSTVEMHPAFRFAMAINQNYEGTKPLDVSFVRRARRRYFIDTLTHDEMFKIAKSELPSDFPEDILNLMVKIAKEIELKYEKERIPHTVVPVTSIVDWGLLYIDNGGDLLKSARPTIIGLTCLDREINLEVENNIVKKYV